MKIEIITTHSCSHRVGLERELQDLGYAYELFYVEEHPDIVALYGIRHSPNLVVNGKVICRGPEALPEGELRRLIEALQ